MPRLIYIGPDPAEHGVVPLQEGWPSADHDEEDEVALAEKLAQRVKLPSPTPDGAPAWGGPVYRLDEAPEKHTAARKRGGQDAKDSASGAADAPAETEV